MSGRRSLRTFAAGLCCDQFIADGVGAEGADRRDDLFADVPTATGVTTLARSGDNGTHEGFDLGGSDLIKPPITESG